MNWLRNKFFGGVFRGVNYWVCDEFKTAYWQIRQLRAVIEKMEGRIAGLDREVAFLRSETELDIKAHVADEIESQKLAERVARKVRKSA